MVGDEDDLVGCIQTLVTVAYTILKNIAHQQNNIAERKTYRRAGFKLAQELNQVHLLKALENDE